MVNKCAGTILIAALLSGCVGVTEKAVIVDGLYDVVVYAQEVGGEMRYSVNDISAWTANRPPNSIKMKVYIDAIEEASGCAVIRDSIVWEAAGIADNAILRASVDCN
jgi:hypothetical protein